jgi:3-deoxy-D-manno-octulosonate 8-phosphate phosphatase (KDO 8-P phosphatase)|tara:strand:+ start:496 stop:1014 length:519 start_codon:yes stop_codon:yes gene_type:complete
MKNKKISINDLDALIFDFDGVLTDNKVHLDQEGNEWVSCNRSDGLAFDVLRKFKKHTYIISTEKNKVVAARAKKLKIPVLFGVQNKPDALKKLSKKKLFNLDRTLYVGNDLNDYEAMKLCGYSACPSDSHKMIKQIVAFRLDAKGGSGVIRELVEKVLRINILNVNERNIKN